MQGLTNAAPPSGGLRIVASGELPAAQKGSWDATVFELPEPAIFVLIAYPEGENRYTAVPLMRYMSMMGSSEYAQIDNSTAFSLSEDGTEIRYWDYQSPKKSYYTAYA